MRQNQYIANPDIARPMYWPAPAWTRRYTRIPSNAFIRQMAAVVGTMGFLLLAGACAGRGDGRPPGATVAVPPGAARLDFRLPAFAAAAGQHTRYTSTDRRYREDFAEWRLDDGATAGLTLSTATTGKPFSDPVQPADVLAIWPNFNDKRPAFGDPGTARNDLGAASYQRVAVGTLACVLFVQRLPAPDPGMTADAQATLSGFYCNPPGVLLTPGAVRTVLRAVVLRPLHQKS